MDAKPTDSTSITQARYQVAYQRESATSEARRRMRHRRREKLWPPGLSPVKWAMAAGMRYGVGSKDSGEQYLVPKDFSFDGASVPILLTILVPRNRADQIFREAMLVLGLHWFWAMILWRGVRAGGWMVWYSKVDQSHTATGRFLSHGRLSYPFGALWVLVLWVVGFTLDLMNFGTYRREAEAVAAQDHS